MGKGFDMSWKKEIKKTWTDRTGKETTFFSKEIPKNNYDSLLHNSWKLNSIINECVVKVRESPQGPITQVLLAWTERSEGSPYRG